MSTTSSKQALPGQKIQPSLRVWKNAIRAAEQLEERTLPELWIELLRLGWRIELTSCACRGSWAWVKPNSQMHGCVCHHTPSKQVNIRVIERHGEIEGYACGECDFRFDLNVKAGALCPGCGNRILGIRREPFENE